jgi:hypothetical protein
MLKSVLKQDNWLTRIFQAWPAVWSASRSPEWRVMAAISAVVFTSLVITDVVSGLLKQAGILADGNVSLFRISEESSIAEFTGYFAMQCAVVFLALLAYRLRSQLHAFFAVLFQYLVFDDMLSLHEVIGERLGNAFFATQTYLPAVAMGEFMFAAAFLLSVGTAFVYALFNSNTYLRSLAAMLLVPIGILGFCAVFLDVAHAAVPDTSKYLGGLLALAEDGGELFAMMLLALTSAAQWLSLPEGQPIVERRMTAL